MKIWPLSPNGLGAPRRPRIAWIHALLTACAVAVAAAAWSARGEPVEPVLGSMPASYLETLQPGQRCLTERAMRRFVELLEPRAHMGDWSAVVLATERVVVWKWQPNGLWCIAPDVPA